MTSRRTWIPAPAAVKLLSRQELTAAHAARQMLLERRTFAPTEAIRLLTPLQGQEPTAPYVALAARLEGFARADLEAAVHAKEVVKTTINRLTLHLAATSEYPAYAQLTRQSRMRSWRNAYPQLDEEEVTAELGRWLCEPRTNEEVRERVREYGIDEDSPWTTVIFARNLLPLVQLPPAGTWADRRRPLFVVDQRPLPPVEDAAALVLTRYLAAFGPASRRDAASWAGVAQRDFASAWDRIETVSYVDEKGVELRDLPDGVLPGASVRPPVRLLSRWDQALLGYADRDRIIPPAVQPLKLTLSGAQTVTVDGRVAASWKLDRGRKALRVQVIPHVDIPRRAVTEIRAEAQRAGWFCVPEATKVEVVGV